MTPRALPNAQDAVEHFEQHPHDIRPQEAPFHEVAAPLVRRYQSELRLPSDLTDDPL